MFIGEIFEAANPNRTGVEAHGIKGFKNTPWRKVFKSTKAMLAWAEKFDAEILGTRDLESAAQGRLAPAISEDASGLNVGDPVIITGDVKFNGATGEISSFGQNNAFVVVDLYNHGRHSFHSSDVGFNDYADSDDEEARMYDDGEFRESATLYDETKPVEEAKGLSKQVRIVKGPDTGATGWIREIKTGAFKGAPKTYFVDLDNGKQANNLPASALRLVKEPVVEFQDAAALKPGLLVNHPLVGNAKIMRIVGNDVKVSAIKGGKMYTVQRSSLKLGPMKMEEQGAGISKDAETTFHSKLDKLVHSTFGKRQDEVAEGGYDTDDYYLPRRGRDYGFNGKWTADSEVSSAEYSDRSHETVPLTPKFEPTGKRGRPRLRPDAPTGGPRGRPAKTLAATTTSLLPADPFNRIDGSIPKSKPGAIHRIAKHGEDLAEDSGDNHEGPTQFFVAMYDGNENTAFVGQLLKRNGQWHERRIAGTAPYSWGSKTYQSYLSVREIMSWIDRDYGDEGNEVKGPFDTVEEAREYAEHQYVPLGEAEGTPEGLPNITPTMARNILNQIETEGPKAISKSIEWGDGAAAEMVAMFKADLKKVAAGEKVIDEACWKNYRQIGMKKKNGKQVPNCVPESNYSGRKDVPGFMSGQ